MLSATDDSSWRRRARLTAYGAAAVAAIAGGTLVTASASFASSKKNRVCNGSLTKPGVLSGKVAGNLLVKGACEVSHGAAKVKGNVTLAPGSVLVAAFAHNVKTHKGHGNLTITGNLVVKSGATAVIGCDASNFPCIDDSQTNPTLHNKVKIGGNLTATAALGVISHSTQIVGNVRQTGGGGGQSCASMPGVFGLFMSPQYSAYELDSIGGRVSISDLASCWLGLYNNHIHGSFKLTGNKMADPDAIEIGSNRIKGNLACSGNTNAVPASAAVWDSTEANPNNGGFYPRTAELNKVKGKRSGQCSRSTPLTMGGAYGAPNTF